MKWRSLTVSMVLVGGLIIFLWWKVIVAYLFSFVLLRALARKHGYLKKKTRARASWPRTVEAALMAFVAWNSRKWSPMVRERLPLKPSMRKMVTRR